jgi:predicted exporter
MFSHLSSMVAEDEIDASAVVSISGATRNVSVALAGHEGETYIDRVELISQSLSDGRMQAQLWLAVALVCLFVGFAATAGLATSFRRLSVVLSGVIGGLGLVTLSGVGLQVFVVLSLLLVVGLSIDYSVFADSYADARQSIICSGLTTVLAFGLLAFSAVPVLQSIGFTVAGGVSAAMLMAFLLRRTQ